MNKNLKIILASLLVTLFFCELLFRAINFDFSFEKENYLKWPIYYRIPREPICNTFFKRPGPDKWHGKVLSLATQLAGVETDTYKDEVEITVHYDQNGFRNGPDLVEWDIVVAGDSFVELGYLTDQQLFTSRIGEILNKKVKNLGVSHSGPLSYSCFLKNFGISKRTQIAILTFFEGNDSDDLNMEVESEEEFNNTNIYPLRNTTHQSSFLFAIGDFLGNLQRLPSRKETTDRFINADFISNNSKTPLTIRYAPPHSDQLSEKTKHNIKVALKRWRTLSISNNIQPWLAYMPSDNRVYNGYLQFRASASERVRNWQISDLPELIKQYCQEQQINFIDLTPILQNQIKQGKIPLNTIWDTHLNVTGSEVVAKEIARVISNSRQ